MTRRLVVNADDLGLTIGVNDGIFDAHDRGAVTSASLFANASATADAIARARYRSSLGVGCHLTLVDGAPTLPPERVPTLVRDDGRFRSSWRPFIVACLTGRVRLDDVERELTAQIDRLRSQGAQLTHLDAHKHVHTFPPIFAVVARLATRFAIPVVRVPWERAGFAHRDRRHQATITQQALLNLALSPWARMARRTAAAQGLRTPRVAGRIHTGILNRRALETIVRSLKPGVTELMTHPGYVDEALRATPTRLLEARAEEVELLTAASTLRLFAEQGVELVSHASSNPTDRTFSHAS
jgi:predicted glycoside hydrolase/deacetylase ChbG (UPF0249 family)